MVITTDDVKKLRDETGVSIMQCKKALEEAGGDFEKAKVILRKQSTAVASKKADRTLGAGIAAAYTHAGGSVVAAVVLACETDFVAKNEAFGKLAYDIAMHVAAMSPLFRAHSDVQEDHMKAAKEIFAAEVANVPEKARELALQGKLDSFLKERILLEQPYIKDSNMTVKQLIDVAIQRFGEKIEVVRFERLSVK